MQLLCKSFEKNQKKKYYANLKEKDVPDKKNSGKPLLSVKIK